MTDVVRPSSLEHRLEHVEGLERAAILVELALRELYSRPGPSAARADEALEIAEGLGGAAASDPAVTVTWARATLARARLRFQAGDTAATLRDSHAVVDVAGRLGLPDLAARAARCYARALAEFGRVPEAHALLQEALAKQRRDHDGTVGLAHLLVGAAQTSHQSGDVLGGNERFSEARAIARELDEPEIEFDALEGLVAGLLATTEHAQALCAADDALALAEAHVDRAMRARALGVRSMALMSADRPANALEVALAGLAEWRTLESPANEAHGAYLVASLLCSAGAASEALPYARESLAVWRELGVRTRECVLLSVVASIQEQMGDLAAARESATRCLALATDVGDAVREFNARLVLSTIARREGGLTAALEHATAAQELGATFGVESARVQASLQLASVHLELGDPRRALEDVERAERHGAVRDFGADLAERHLLAARSHAALGEMDAAYERLSRGREADRTQFELLASMRLADARARSELAQARAEARHATERAARRSAARQAAIVENTPNVPVVVVDVRGTVQQWNRAAEVVTGWSADEARGRPMTELVVPPRNHALYAEILEEVDRTGTPRESAERTFLRKDGSTGQALVSTFPLVSDDGERVVVHMMLDVSPLQEARRGLATSELRYRVIAETASDAILTIDSDSIIHFANPAAAMFGYAIEDLVGTPITRLIPEDARDRHHTGPDRFCTTGERSMDWPGMELVALHADGSTFPVEVAFGAYADADGRRLFTGIVRNASERRLLLDALKLSEAKFSAAFFASPDAIAISSRRDHRMIEVNAGFEEMFGHTRDEAVGRSTVDLGMWQRPEERGEMLATLDMNGRVNRMEVDIRHRTGRLGVADLSIELIEVGGEPCFLTVARDITIRKQAEEQLRAALAEVERLRDRLQAENVVLQEELRIERGGDGGIVGSSPVVQEMLATIRRVAPTDTTVIIVGETGTGKELVAAALHELSGRAGRTMVKVNCAVVAAGLIESELFGHERGAFTGADAQRKGRFEVADGGTIFLDEVGELPLESQSKLLRVLQEQEFERVGSSESISVDVRVIAATNRDLETAVAEGRFRNDLYYRLNVFPITVAPLRERGEDVPELATHFLRGMERRIGKRFDGIGPAALAWMKTYDWPGNVRELRNFVERAVILSDGPVLDHVDALPAARRAQDSPEMTRSEEQRTLDEMQRQHITEVLVATGWKVEGPHGAAERLGLSPSTLRSRMKKLGVRR